jgi:hypothetical protein
MDLIPDANTLDNNAHLQKLVNDTVKEIKLNISSNLKKLATTPINTYSINISSFLPSIDQLGENYNSILFEICEIICRTLVSKGYQIVTDVSKNSTYSVIISWRKKIIEGKCPTFTKYLKNDNID